MTVLQAVFYLLAIILLIVAAFGVPQVGRVSLVILAAAFALFAFVEPGLAHTLGG
jgi:hypothetical protein